MEAPLVLGLDDTRITADEQSRFRAVSQTKKNKLLKTLFAIPGVVAVLFVLLGAVGVFSSTENPATRRRRSSQPRNFGPDPQYYAGERVLLIGGWFNTSSLATVESTGNCTDDPDDLPAPTQSGAASVYGGEIYFCGGILDFRRDTSSCYINVPGESEWRTGPSMKKDRRSLTLNTVGDRLVAVGGEFFSESDTVEVLDPVSHTWTLQDYTLDETRNAHCAVTISDTTLMLIGGSYRNTTQLLDIDTGSVISYSEVPYSYRLSGHACTLYEKKIVMAGGIDGDIRYSYSTVYTLDPSDTGNPWVSAGSLVKTRAFHTMEIVNGVLTVFGGYFGEEIRSGGPRYRGDGSIYLDSIEERNPDGTWSITGKMKEAKASLASVVIDC